MVAMAIFAIVAGLLYGGFVQTDKVSTAFDKGDRLDDTSQLLLNGSYVVAGRIAAQGDDMADAGEREGAIGGGLDHANEAMALHAITHLAESARAPVAVLDPAALVGEVVEGHRVDAVDDLVDAEVDQGQTAAEQGDDESGRHEPPPGAALQGEAVLRVVEHRAERGRVGRAQAEERQRRLEQDGDVIFRLPRRAGALDSKQIEILADPRQRALQEPGHRGEWPARLSEGRRPEEVVDDKRPRAAAPQRREDRHLVERLHHQVERRVLVLEHRQRRLPHPRR